MAKVSILIPFYNVEKYINQCLKSIANQTYADFEVILVDDGSTDTSYEIVEQYLLKDNRFKCICVENRGVAVARQIALEHATGEYVLYLDSDDWVDKEMLSDMMQVITLEQADGVCAGVITEQGTRSIVSCPVEKAEKLQAIDLLRMFFERKFVATLKCYLLKRQLWEGFQFPADISVGEDMAGLIYVLERANAIYALPKAYYHYRQNSTSIVHSNLSQGKINAYYFEKNMQDKIVKIIPDDEEAVRTWYIQDEIYLVSAMARSKDYRPNIGSEISKHCRKNIKMCLKSKYLGHSYKISVIMLSIHGRVYYSFYRLIYHYLGNLYSLITKNEK